MYRTAGLLSLVVAAALTYSLAFTSFDKPIDSWMRGAEGRLEQVIVECPTPWSIVFGDAELQVEPAWQGQRCVPAARILVFESAVVLLAGLGSAAWGMKKGPRPPQEPIESLKTARVGSLGVPDE